MHYEIVKNKDIELIKVKANNYRIELLNIGATIFKIFTSDINNNYENIVLSLDCPSDYLSNSSYLGCTIGRNAGRIENGTFLLNNEIISIKKNSHGNNLHSSGDGCHNKIFNSKIFQDKEKIIVKYNILLRERDDGFPGNIKIEVIYKLFPKKFKIIFKALSSKDTICNITNHSYFNLLGNKKNHIKNHILQNSFTSIFKLNNKSIPIKPIASQRFFGSHNKLMIQDIQKNNQSFFRNAGGIDHPFVFNSKKELLLEEKTSGRKLRIKTSYPIVIIYTHNFKIPNIDNLNMGIAIEPQYLPNDINYNMNSKTLLLKNQEYEEFIKYSFN